MERKNAYILNPHADIVLFDGGEDEVYIGADRVRISYQALERVVALPWVARKIARYLPRKEVEDYLMRCLSDCLTWPKEIEKVLPGKPITEREYIYFIGEYPILAMRQKIVGKPELVREAIVRPRAISIYDKNGSITFSNFSSAIDGFTRRLDQKIKYSPIDVPAAYGARSTTWLVVDRKAYEKYCPQGECPWIGHNRVYPW